MRLVPFSLVPLFDAVDVERVRAVARHNGAVLARHATRRTASVEEVPAYAARVFGALLVTCPLGDKSNAFDFNLHFCFFYISLRTIRQGLR